MINWVNANLGTVFVCVILVAVIAIVLYDMIRKKQKGSFSCTCNCGGCPVSGTCHKRKEEPPEEKTKTGL